MSHADHSESESLEAPPSTGPDDRPILVFGGTFDPPHSRHVALLAGADKMMRAKRVLVVPAWANPQRPEGARAPQADRTAMCSIAFQDLADTTISTVEIDQKQPCFTVDTLERLHAQQKNGELPSGPFRLLIGSDQALNFKTWKDWERVLTLAAPAVVLRPPHQRWEWQKLLIEVWDEAWTKRWIEWTLPIDPVDVSSTNVRQRVAAGTPLDDLVPAGVASYINSRGLYGATPAQ